MKIREYVTNACRRTGLGARLLDDKRYRVLCTAVTMLIVHLLYAFYNGILGVLSSSLLFLASAVYYFLLCIMRFSVILIDKKGNGENGRAFVSVIGVMLIILSVIFSVIVYVSIKDNTAATYGTIPMLTITTFTFAKITVVTITTVKHRKENMRLYRAANTIRCSEVAVSLLTMQQSMLVSFGDGDENAVLLNACTGAAVCLFILALGIFTLKNNTKKEPSRQNLKSQKQ